MSIVPERQGRAEGRRRRLRSRPQGRARAPARPQDPPDDARIEGSRRDRGPQPDPSRRSTSQLSYWSPGISGDRLIYPDNDFFSSPIGKIPGSASDSLRDAFKLLYSNWNVGVTLSVPVGSIVSKADLSYARADLAQSQVRLRSLEQQVALEVSDALRTVETNAKRVEAYRVARELAEKSLDAEIKKLQVGLSTNYFVFEFQDRLANARSIELRAKIDSILSAERLEKAMGVSLDKRGFKIAN